MKEKNYPSKNESAINNSKLLSERVNLNENLSNNKHEKEEKTSKPKIQLVPPDGGWGWVVLAGCLITTVLSTMSYTGFGILFSTLLMNLSVSSTNVGWIITIYSFIVCISAFFVHPLYEEFGWRKVAITGGIIHFLSIALSAFAPSAQFLFFSYSLLGGSACGTGVALSRFIVSRYFLKFRGFALAVITLGQCISGFISPLLSNFLLEQYGHMGAVLIFAAIILNQAAIGGLFQPVEWHMKRVEDKIDFEDFSEENTKDIDFEEMDLQAMKVKHCKNRRESEISGSSVGSLGQSFTEVSPSLQNNITTLNNEAKVSKKGSITSLILRILTSFVENLKLLQFLQVIIIAIGSAFLILGSIMFEMWISFVVMDAGHTLQMAAWCVSSAAIANIFARICMTLLSDRPKFSVKFVHMFSTLFIGISIIAFTLVKDIRLLLLFICCWGFSVGTTTSLHSMVMIGTMGLDMFPAVYGVSALTSGVLVLIFGPIIGAIRDATSSYRYALWTIGGLGIIAFCLWMMMPLAKKYDRKKQNDKVMKGMEDFS